MVKYYGRARQRIGSVNTRQLGLKMSGCPSRVGRKGTIDRYISQRVSCLRGVCGGSLVNGVLWNHKKISNNPPFCKVPSGKCLAAAGGIGNINTPYYKTNAPGTKGCGVPVTGVPPGGSAPRSIVQRGVNGEILSVRVPRTLHSTYRIGYEVTPVITTAKQNGLGRGSAIALLSNTSTMHGHSQVLDDLGLQLTGIYIFSAAPADAISQNYIQFIFDSNKSKSTLTKLFIS